MSHYYPLNCIDFYKAGHRQQYPEGTELVVSNFTPRSGKHSNVANKEGVVFFGLQYFIKEYLIDMFQTHFFSRAQHKDIPILPSQLTVHCVG